MFKNLIQSKNEIVLQNTVINDNVLTWGERQGYVVYLVLRNHKYSIAAPFLLSHMPTGLANLVEDT